MSTDLRKNSRYRKPTMPVKNAMPVFLPPVMDVIKVPAKMSIESYNNKDYFRSAYTLMLSIVIPFSASDNLWRISNDNRDSITPKMLYNQARAKFCHRQFTPFPNHKIFRF